MKICNILAIILLAAAVIYPQWKPINELTENIWLNSVYFTDDSHGWIAGSIGTILKYDPETMDWFKVNSGSTEDLNSIGFFDHSTGITVGENGILLLSFNGGSSWSQKSLGVTYEFNELYIFNPTTAYLAGNNGALFKTTNKGVDWLLIPIPTVKNLNSVKFISETTGFAAGDSASFFITRNGGLTWTEQSFLPPNPTEIPSLNAICFFDSLNGFVGGGYSRLYHILYKTTDGGITWTDESSSVWGMVRDIQTTGTDDCIIVGGSIGWDRFLTVKNGTYQTLIYHNEDYDIMSVAITPTGKGWAVGGGGAIFHSDDYNGRWGQLFVGSEDKPAALSVSHDNIFFIESIRNNFRDPSTVTIRGFYDNRLFRDVSRYWNDSGYDDIVTLHMIDAEYGYKYPSMQKTTDGGYTWNSFSSPEYLDGIHFISRTTGWLFGDKIYKTADGGTNWVMQYDADFKIIELTFSDANTGYAVGSDADMNGRAIKTTDGGNTWTQLNIPDAGHLTSVSFSDNNKGVITGWGNTLFITKDGGVSWRKVSANRPQVRQAALLKPVTLKGDRRVKLVKNISGPGYIEYRPMNSENYLDAEYKGSVVLVASDAGSIIKSYNDGRFFVTEHIGSEVLEVKYDGIKYALARTQNNVYLQNVEEERSSGMIVSLTGRIENSAAVLEWITSSGDNSTGYRIERNRDGSWEEAAYITAQKNSSDNQAYNYTDNIVISGEVKYRIRQVNQSGSSFYTEAISIGVPVTAYTLGQNYPNPFNPSTKINFTVPKQDYVTIKVYDITGSEVTTLVNKEMNPGSYIIDFNAEKLTSGIYFYRITAGEFSETKKMQVLK
jgi:photosystem II stability/assembly factor-like uncharacterized protein